MSGRIAYKRRPSAIALFQAIAISLCILGLFYYWFAVADRHAVFLYGHLGATPFDEVTSSRYWMSGLVASGMVMIGYATSNWLLGRVAALCCEDYCPPAWWQVWVFCVAPVLVGVPAITMTLNRPTLPISHAAACVVATLIGLALALMPGSWAAQRPVDLGWLVFDGMGLMPVLLGVRVVELPNRDLASPLTRAPTAYLIALVAALAGVAWSVIMTGLRAWRQKSVPGGSALFASGLCLSYLLMPLVHHLLFTPPRYRYISTAANFFASNVGLQLMAFSVAATLAVGITRLRRRSAMNGLRQLLHFACSEGLRE